MGVVIGVDLGTTNSVVSAYVDGKSQILPNFTGQFTTPSVVSFQDDGPPLVGPSARDQQVTNPLHTVYSIKRFMGRRQHEVASEEKIVPYEIVGGANQFVRVRVNKKLYTPQQISALVLRELKNLAEGHLGRPVDGAVVTVPAYFNDAQRQATRDAGEIAGLNIERIINEPTAAALAYGLERDGDRKIIVFDFGGGTFDLSAMEVNGSDFRVLGVDGDTHLGGDDFDQRIIEVIAEDFLRKERIDLRTDPMALQRLKQAAAQAKHEISERLETDVMLPYVAVDGDGPKHLQYRLTRERFEAVCSDLFQSIRDACHRLKTSLGNKALGISEIVLVGGSTRIPMVRRIAMEVFETDRLNKNINPDEVVAMGAGILGGVIQGDLKNVNLMDVTSHSFGVETAMGGMGVIVPRNTPIPTKVERIFSTPEDNQRSVPVNVLEGESEKAVENRTLGLFRLKGIRKAKAGVPRIGVEFAIDANGILQVTATDKDTGQSQEIVVQGGHGLDREELEEMRAESESFGEQQEEVRETVDLKNHAEGVLANMGEWYNANGRYMKPKERDNLVTMLRKLQTAIEKNSTKGMKSALKKLDEVPALRRAG